MVSKGPGSLGKPMRTKRSVGAYGSTRGVERQKRRRENRMQDGRVRTALAETRAEQEALEKRIAAETEHPVSGAALGAQYADMLKTPEPEPEPIPVPAPPRMADQVKLVEPNAPRRRIVGRPEVLGDTRSITVDKDLWHDVVVEPGIDPRCVQIISEKEIVVWNNPGQWRWKRTA